jgi:hypothetical protein
MEASLLFHGDSRSLLSPAKHSDYNGPARKSNGSAQTPSYFHRQATRARSSISGGFAEARPIPQVVQLVQSLPAPIVLFQGLGSFRVSL